MSKMNRLQKLKIEDFLIGIIIFFVPYTKFRIAGLKMSEILTIGLVLIEVTEKRVKIRKKSMAFMFVICFSTIITASAIISFFDPINKYVYGIQQGVFYSFEYGWIMKTVRLIIVFMFMLSVKAFCKKENGMENICNVYILSNVLIDICISVDSIKRHNLIVGVTRNVAMAVEPAEAGFINCIAIVFSFFLFLNEKTKIRKSKRIIELLILIMGQLVIGSTGSLVALAGAIVISACVFLLKKKEKIAYKFIQVGLIFILGLVGCTVLIQKTSILDKIINYKYFMNVEGSSVAERLGAITTCIEIFKQRPILGVGFGNYGWYIAHFITTDLYKYVPGGAFQPNNQYFQLLAEVGIVGALVYLAFIYGITKEIIKEMNKGTAVSLWKGTFLLCLCAYFLIHNFTLPTLYSFQFWILSAFVECLEEKQYDR